MAPPRSSHGRRNPSVDIPRYPPQARPPPPEPIAQPQLLIPQASDYESDNPGYASDWPSHPPPPRKTNEELNLSVLQRHNNDVTAIVSIAPYAVIYEFQPLPEPAWSKTGIEGSLFNCQLTRGPLGEERFAAIVLNRRGMDNFEAPLTEGENAGVEITQEYVILSFKQEHEQKIYGVYIFSEGPGTSTEQTRIVTGEILKALAVTASSSRQAAEQAASAAQARHTNGHIQEAEENLDHDQMSAPMGRQISLQQLFGQQRKDDAAWSVRAHNVDGPSDQPPQPQSYATAAQAGRAQPPSYAAAASSRAAPQQSDVLTNLFRNAGVGLK